MWWARGPVIDVNMTHDMLAKARENARKNGFSNVEFRLGEIESLPVADNSVDVVISGCCHFRGLGNRSVFRSTVGLTSTSVSLQISCSTN